MKTLLLVFAISISISNFSQVLTISYTKTDLFYNEGEYDELNLLSPLENEPVYSVSDVKITKVLDLNEMIAYIYDEETLFTVINIKDYKSIDGIYVILLDDISLIDGSPLDTYQIIDTNKKLSYYCWSYIELNENWVLSETLSELEIK